MTDIEQETGMIVSHMFTINCAKACDGSMSCGHKHTVNAKDAREAQSQFQIDGWRVRNIVRGWLCPHHAVNVRGTSTPVRVIRWRTSAWDQPIISIGWLLSEGDDGHRLTMTLTLDGDPDADLRCITIPNDQVISLMDIRADRPSIDIVAGGWT